MEADGGGGGVRGILSGGIILDDVGDFAVAELGEGGLTAPGGGGSEVAGLADPGITADLELDILGLVLGAGLMTSAKCL